MASADPKDKRMLCHRINSWYVVDNLRRLVRRAHEGSPRQHFAGCAACRDRTVPGPIDDATKAGVHPGRPAPTAEASRDATHRFAIMPWPRMVADISDLGTPG